MLVATSTAAPVAAETIDVFDRRGGRVAEYDAQWAGLAGRGMSVLISGSVPVGRHRPASSHSAQPDLRDGRGVVGFRLLPTRRKRPLRCGADTWSGYPGDIRAWQPARPRLKRNFVWLGAEIFRFFRKCPT
jgi:hypothetical protein